MRPPVLTTDHHTRPLQPLKYGHLPEFFVQKEGWFWVPVYIHNRKVYPLDRENRMRFWRKRAAERVAEAATICYHDALFAAGAHPDQHYAHGEVFECRVL